MKDTSETIEFFTPVLGLELQPYLEAQHKQGIHHLARYHWARIVLSQSKPANVLDVACGAGYGTYLMATSLPDTNFIGADYDERAVSYAKKRYKAPNLRFVQGDIVRWVSKKGSLGKYDAITSFDTIEHLLHREISLLRMSEHLTESGCLLLSTPCGHIETRLHPGWEHHKIEYSYTDLLGLLRRFFGRVYQPQDPGFIGYEFWTDVVNAGTVRYLNRANPLICMDPIIPGKEQGEARVGDIGKNGN